MDGLTLAEVMVFYLAAWLVVTIFIVAILARVSSTRLKPMRVVLWSLAVYLAGLTVYTLRLILQLHR
jgi:hypothetical protein